MNELEDNIHKLHQEFGIHVDTESDGTIIFFTEEQYIKYIHDKTFNNTFDKLINEK